MNKKLKQSHRERELIDTLRRLGGSARSADLAITLGVSEETVRRTIKALSKSGALERMYGGAYLAGPRDTHNFFHRIARHSTEKRRIALAVDHLLQDGMTLFLDVGFTTAFVAEKLRGYSNLTIATNSIGVAQVLANHNGNRVHFLGGEMQTDKRGTFGFETEQQSRKFAYDLAVFSADALSERFGFLYLNAAEANLAAVIASSAEKVAVVLDHHKFDQTAPHCGLDANLVDLLITDEPPGESLARAIEAWNIEIHLAVGADHDAPN
ncbi:DeoR family transcriptional regulator [Sulfitobacter sp. SK012]|uniref:DeoR/GlpR family DNA-binding transcription regulator n=1 Tax=Sulfitobacter sp. SK012 TaxID=1389005 RepID=UPI000E0AE0F6|nr:DeoR/GlpR family DNA-binding transcription regulator [Sulfitobacter sp. SK012]AXI45628.1 DeoR family transcriptional regulator [Sulfitobacter sp. SK012]